ncbi:MAG: guanylate kinase [Flavobacteriales bacterium]|nr:guanylate kinase [Flavobacteriales bacterium]
MSSDKPGKSIIVSAPSGAGKTTLVKHLLKSRKDLSFSVSATNRPIRKNEKDGKDYQFLSTSEFKNKIKNDELLEWEEVYEGRFYGTLHSEVQRIWDSQKHVVFDVDVIGGIHLKKKLKRNAIAIFVSPGDISVLEKRLIARGTDSESDVEARLKKAAKEMKKAAKFDVIILNDDLEKAKKEIVELVENFISND